MGVEIVLRTGEKTVSFADIYMGQIKAIGRHVQTVLLSTSGALTLLIGKRGFIVVCDLVHSKYVCREIIFQASSGCNTSWF